MSRITMAEGTITVATHLDAEILVATLCSMDEGADYGVGTARTDNIPGDADFDVTGDGYRVHIVVAAKPGQGE